MEGKNTLSYGAQTSMHQQIVYELDEEDPQIKKVLTQTNLI